jgi:hypothetical protein
MSLNETYLSDEISLKEEYDYEGAFFFIFFTIISYGLFVVGLLYTLNQSSESDYYEDSDDPREVTARSLIKNLRAEDIVKRDALGIS